MSSLKIYLFGKFRVLSADRELKGLDSSRVQELFCYLILYRDRKNDISD